MRSVVTLLLLLCVGVLSAAAQEPTDTTPLSVPPGAAPGTVAAEFSLEFKRFSSAPVIDGKLDDAVWQEGNLLENFIQLEPENGKPATQKTEARVGYDAESLYFGVRCYDTEPKKILASGMSLDVDLSNDDSISVILDTFHDLRNAFMFSVNSAGAKTDSLVRNEGEQITTEWDGLWDAVARRDDEGWTVEIAIPFRTLRFSRTSPQTWGFNLRRHLPRRQEASFWKPMTREFGYLAPYHFSEYGEIRGLEGIAPGGHYQFVPYTLARNDDYFREDPTSFGRIGGDLKFNITSDLVADLTVRTDFAEVESDQLQFNLNRFKLFYPEKRDFFLEGSNLFFFGDRPEPFDVPEKFYFFFSRTIGLAEDGRVEVPVLAGAKLSGRVGGTSVGFLSISTEDTEYVSSLGLPVEEPRTNFSVLRLKQDIYPRSTIGLIGLNKDPSGNDYNRGIGADWDLAFGKDFYSAGWITKTYTPGVDGRDSAWSADLVYQKGPLRLRHRYTDIGENFNPEMGFVTRTGIKKNDSLFFNIMTFDKQPLKIHRWVTAANLNHIADQQGNLVTQLWTIESSLIAANNSGIAFIYYPDKEVLTAPLRVAKNAVIPPGHYDFESFFTGIGSGYSQKLGFTAWYHTGGYYDGDRLRTLLAALYRPTSNLAIAPQWDRIKVDAPWGNFVTEITQVALEYAYSPTLAFRSIVQRQTDDTFRGNLLIDWIYRPGSHLFVVYNDIEDLDEVRKNLGFSPYTPGRSIIVKLNRRFDF